MKILYSCLSKSWGGMEMVTLTGIKQLLKRGIKVDLLCISESRIQREANNLGIIIHPIKLEKILNPFSILKISAIVRTGCYDLIHSHASKDLWLIVPALKHLKSNIPFIFTKHVGSYIIKKDFLHKKIYDRVNLVVAISTVVANNLINTTPLTEDKIKIIFNGVDIEKFNPGKVIRSKIRNELSITENEILIGMTGRFSPGKGHEELLKGAKLLSEKYANLKFLIVGEASRGEDEYAKSIKQLAQNYELKNIHFVGFRSDIQDVLAALDIFIFPSHAEAFGIALIEAMAMGKPSVCSGSDGVLDIAVDNETSFLFKVKDAVDLKEKLEKLILDPKLREAFGKASRKRVIEKFDLEKITDDTINTYSKIIKDRI